MTQLGSGMDITPRGSMDAIVQSIKNEIQADISRDLIERVIRVVTSSMATTAPTVTAQINVPPSNASVEVAAPTVHVINDMDLSMLEETNTLLRELITVLRRPQQRQVTRNTEGLIVSVTDRPM